MQADGGPGDVTRPPASEAPPSTTHYNTRAMASALRATITGTPRRRATVAWARIVADVARSEAVLSRFRAESDLSRLNRSAGDGAWRIVDPRLYTLIATAVRAQRLTAGRFDARVLRRLEELGERAGVPLPALALPSTRGDIERRPRDRLVRTTEPLDSGGLGKGLALRWAAAAGLAALPAGAGLLVEAGGDVLVTGPQPDGGAWRIGIEDPLGSDEPLAVLELERGAVATSSVAVRHWTGPGGDAVHHLIDPRTGEPGGGGLLAVTVSLPDPAWAEVWTKALFLAGPAAIGPEARSRGLAAWWVRDGGGLEMTPAARAATIWERPIPSRRSA